MPSFKTRVATFWNWFTENEKQLLPYFENPKETDPTPTRQLLGSALSEVIPDMPFEFGGDHEINLSANGRREMAFLTYYLANSIPKALATRWKITPLKPAITQNFEIAMGEHRLGIDNVMVRMDASGDDSFYLHFHNSALAEMDESDAYFFFFILMDATLGENMSICHIDGVEKADAASPDMIPLSTLRETIIAELAKDGKAPAPSPCEYYAAYSANPDEEGAPAHFDLRHDIITGFTCQNRLIGEYYNDDDDTFKLYQSAGASVSYLWYEHNHEDLGEALNERNDIADHIVEEVLGQSDSGREIGLNTGQATAQYRCYIDFLLYDEPAFLEQIGYALRNYGYTFHYSEFRSNAPSKELQ